MTDEVVTQHPDLINTISALVETARTDTADGFRAFYILVHGRPAPAHVDPWIEALYGARGKAKGTVIRAFRGSTKTTTLTTFIAWRLGLEPHKASLVVQVNDEVSWDNTEKIADIVQHNKAFEMVFPHVRPDEGKGWGASGYEVKRVDIPYPQWRAMNSARKDPSFVGVGYKSGSILGKHPDGVLLVDDINDEKNTASERELATVRKIITDTLFPTITAEAWNIFIGTPWTTNDVLGYVESTGQFAVLATPVLVDGKPTWPEKFNEEEIERQRKLSGEFGFARMMMLDLKLAEGINLRKEWLHDYPDSSIGVTWPVVFGVDYASTADRVGDQDRDYFALTIARKIPGGGLVIVDGVREHLSQGEAEARVRAVAAAYPSLQLIGVESLGKGEEFYSLLLRNSTLPIYPLRCANRSKGERFQIQMAPLFEFSRVWVSDADTTFLRAFRAEWVSWPMGKHDDTLDSTYYAIAAAQYDVTPGMEMDASLARPWYGRQKHSNPWAVIGGRYG